MAGVTRDISTRVRVTGAEQYKKDMKGLADSLSGFKGALNIAGGFGIWETVKKVLTGVFNLLKDCVNESVEFDDAMTGVACADIRLPLLPGTTTLLVLKNRPVRPAQPCIGCGRCAAVCHAELLPYEIVRRLENMHYERLQHLSPWECDGCSACSYVCPAGRPVAAEVLRAGEQHGTVFLNWGDDPDE